MARDGETGRDKTSFSRRLESALADRKTSSQLITELSKADGRLAIVAAFLGTSTSTTTDFGDVLDGDTILEILDADQVIEVATADGTKPSAATVGAYYQIMRPIPAITS